MEKPTPAIIRELLDYNPETGVLIWRKRESRWFNSDHRMKWWNTRFAGKRAGSLRRRKTGYTFRALMIFNRIIAEHQVVWMWMTDTPLPEEIDHINQDATDNRWLNLRASDRLRNKHNRSLPINSSTGVMGVCFIPTRKARPWKAHCFYRGERNHLGYHHTKEEAARAVAQFREGKGFSKQHGQQLAHYHAGGEDEGDA